MQEEHHWKYKCNIGIGCLRLVLARDACILEHALFWSGWRDFLLKPIPKEIVKGELYDFESA